MATFGRLTDLVNRGLKLNDSGLFFHVFSQDYIQQYIILQNTRGQLFEGIDAEGTLLESIGGDYTAYTIEIKDRKNQPSDRVTLKDTGEFYKSFSVDVGDDEFTINANYMKGGEDLRNRWGVALAGLTDESKTMLAKYILPEVREFTLNYLLGGKVL